STRNSLIKIYPDDFWDYFAAFFYQNRIPFMQIQPFHFVGIVQSCPFYCSTCKQYWFKIGNGSYSAGSAYLISNFFQYSLYFLRLVFIANCPTWRFCRKAQFLLLCVIINF